jgi:hypothetical protein
MAAILDGNTMKPPRPGKWVVVWRAGGKQIWRTFASRDEARALVDQLGDRSESLRGAPKSRSRDPIEGVGLDYESLFARQTGRCAICRREPPAGRRFARDHCHATGRIRGLLCYQCNSLLGLAADRPEILCRAASYLLEAARLYQRGA